MNIDPTIFKAYDIRGLYPNQINGAVAYRIGRAFGIFVKDFYKTKKPRVIIGYDIRNSSEELFEGISQALLDENCRVVNMGLCTTPLNYFANWHSGVEASVMITASHNPKDYNGFKLSLKEVTALAEINGMEEIKKLSLEVEKENKREKEQQRKEAERRDFGQEYLDFLAEEAKGSNFSEIRLAVDCSNGAVGPIFKRLAKRIGLNYKGLFMEPNGDFPNHEPNPLDTRALVSLRKLIKQEKIDLGIIFDGDGDRIGVIDEEGRVVENGFLIGLLAQHFLSETRNKKVVCDTRIGRGPAEMIRGVGGEIIKSKVGYPYLRKAMREGRVFFGGELSGHFYWQDFSYSESAFLSMIRLLKILAKKNQPISKLIEPMRRYFNSGEINFKVKDRDEMMKKIEERFSDGKISKLDGLIVEYKNWWFGLRPSNTEPVLRLTVEADSSETLKQKVKEIESLIKR